MYSPSNIWEASEEILDRWRGDRGAVQRDKERTLS